MFRLLKGFGVTLNYFRKKNITIQYPEEKVIMPERFRGIQRFFPDKCIVCNLCVQVCPTDVITLTGKKSEENPKKKVIDTYNIDFQGCILCDFCTEVCPTEAIVMTARYDNLSEFNRSSHFKDMKWLTDNHVPGNYTEPDPEEEARKAAEEKEKAEAKKKAAAEKKEKEAVTSGAQADGKTDEKPKVETAKATEKPEAKAEAEKSKPEADTKTSEKPVSKQEEKTAKAENPADVEKQKSEAKPAEQVQSGKSEETEKQPTEKPEKTDTDDGRGDDK